MARRVWPGDLADWGTGVACLELRLGREGPLSPAHQAVPVPGGTAPPHPRWLLPVPPHPLRTKRRLGVVSRDLRGCDGGSQPPQPPPPRDGREEGMESCSPGPAAPSSNISSPPAPPPSFLYPLGPFCSQLPKGLLLGPSPFLSHARVTPCPVWAWGIDV